MIKVFSCAFVVRHDLLVWLATTLSPESEQCFDVARGILELFVEEAFDSESEPDVLLFEVDSLVGVVEVLLQVS